MVMNLEIIVVVWVGVEITITTIEMMLSDAIITAIVGDYQNVVIVINIMMKAMVVIPFYYSSKLLLEIFEIK